MGWDLDLALLSFAFDHGGRWTSSRGWQSSRGGRRRGRTKIT